MWIEWWCKFTLPLEASKLGVKGFHSSHTACSWGTSGCCFVSLLSPTTNLSTPDQIFVCPQWLHQTECPWLGVNYKLSYHIIRTSHDTHKFASRLYTYRCYAPPSQVNWWWLGDYEGGLTPAVWCRFGRGICLVWGIVTVHSHICVVLIWWKRLLLQEDNYRANPQLCPA